MSPGLFYSYSLHDALTEFFAQTSVTRSECDVKATELVGGKPVPVEIQSNCSYTVYAGQDVRSVVHFRPELLFLPLESLQLTRSIHGSIVPAISFHGLLGDSGKKLLLIYLTNESWQELGRAEISCTGSG
jgi:hypothetical protein